MILLTTLYAIAALALAIYTVGHGILLFQYLRHRNQEIPPQAVNDWAALTVQLPIYNERYVAVRLIDAVAQLDYPADKLHIQILDDSDDDTTRIIAQQLALYPHLNIQHIRRPVRDGFKAGALAYGLTQTDAPYVAIFDADFVPPSDFLQRTMPHLQTTPNLAVVQTRWGHLNPTANALTRAQVISIDNHFLVEQAGRNRSGWMLPFNGTGGVWRTETIAASGGWSDDTLTEDLDLSFRAQLLGWQSLYLPEIVVLGELPPQLAAYRQQQARWAKGGSQCFRKLMPTLWQSDVSLMTKLMATHHLAQYFPHLLMLVILLLSPFLILTGEFNSISLAPLGLVGLIPPLMYLVSQQVQGDGWGKRLLGFPILLLLGTGLIWHNALAVLSGLLSMKGTFQRTPKFASQQQNGIYNVQSQSAIVGQLLMLLYSLWGLWLAWQFETTFVPYFLIHALSFAFVTVWDMREQWQMGQGLVRTRLLSESGND